MSFLARTFRSSRAPLRPLRPLASFHTTSIRRAMGESDLGNKQDREDLEKEREKHKHDSVQKAKDGKGHWKEELASDSEEAVAGDRHDHSMEEMQKMGEQKGEKDKKS